MPLWKWFAFIKKPVSAGFGKPFKFRKVALCKMSAFGVYLKAFAVTFTFASFQIKEAACNSCKPQPLFLAAPGNEFPEAAQAAAIAKKLPFFFVHFQKRFCLVKIRSSSHYTIQYSRKNQFVEVSGQRPLLFTSRAMWYDEPKRDEGGCNMKSVTYKEELFDLSDAEYREFSAKLIPTVPAETVIGVRTPALRSFAKEIAGTKKAQEFLGSLPHKWFDENQLHAFLISGIKDYERCISEVNSFLPFVDNWATCDQLVPKVFKKHTKELLSEIKKWLKGSTYEVRFGIKMLMTFFLDEKFNVSYAELVSKIRSDEYYINMMIAWYFATALAKQYEAVLPFITEKKLAPWTHNKAIQKAIESYRITNEQKEFLRTLKI